MCLRIGPINHQDVKDTNASVARMPGDAEIEARRCRVSMHLR